MLMVEETNNERVWFNIFFFYTKVELHLLFLLLLKDRTAMVSCKYIHFELPIVEVAFMITRVHYVAWCSCSFLSVQYFNRKSRDTRIIPPVQEVVLWPRPDWWIDLSSVLLPNSITDSYCTALPLYCRPVNLNGGLLMKNTLQNNCFYVIYSLKIYQKLITLV